MNKPRYRLVLNVSGKPENPLQGDWQELLSRFELLEYRVAPFHRKEIWDIIKKQKKVLKTQNPTNKLYRSILKKLEELETEAKELGRLQNNGK